ncbi:MAG: triphosphoribosyl-dephospho-CoA synthase [Gammaproteobacteria bacterium]
MIRIAAPALAEAVLRSCRLDVEALKPGNVSVQAPGHGMSAADFIRSAEAAAPLLCAPDLSVGERILRSIEATQRATGCNTNLGIVLLCAPLAHAVVMESPEGRLRPRLAAVLGSLTLDDARWAFAAIALASPAGLGQCARHDVRGDPRVNLTEAMAAAQTWDRIAFQYANDFIEVFDVGVPCIERYIRPGCDDATALRWATVACYLRFLATFRDSHIERKYGPARAEGVRRVAKEVESQFKACENLINAMPLLQDFDNNLKREGLNPGTSADLTVASLLAFHLEYLLAGLNREQSCGCSSSVMG